MLWLCKRVVPQVLQILLLFTTAVVTDGFTEQIGRLAATPTLNQTMFNAGPGDADDQVRKSPNYLLIGQDAPQLVNLVIRTYLNQVAVTLIPASPGLFFQSDRAPPYSFQ